MDKYSISYTSPSRRTTSRIYQDLAAYSPLLNRTYTTKTNQSNMGSATTKPVSKDPSAATKVCVIGAGISGLRCADILLQYGFEVTIIEARDRIGGRMHQITLPSGRLVDLGPNWIHGTENNTILDIVKETGTVTHSWGDDLVGNTFSEDGKLLKDGAELFGTMWEIIMQAFQYSEDNCATIDSKKSLHDFFVEKVEELVPGDGKAEEKRKIVMQMSKLWGAFVGSPIETQSLKFFWLEECVEGENLFCAGTYQKVLTYIAKNAVKKSDVKLRSRVTGIDTSAENTVTVTTDNGLQLEFDEVVMTAPLGWLKSHKKVFKPDLPPRFLQAVDAIGYGSLEKVYITFPRAFWLGEEGKPDKNPFTGFVQWLCPNYAKDTNPKGWSQESVDMATLPGSCSHPTLLFYLFGDHSAALASQLSTLPSQSQRDDHLTKFFKPYYSLLPHYEKSSEDCKPVSCYATTWVLDEFAGNGSYTTFRTGLEAGDKDIEVMREGLPDKGLWFAGEHTAPFVALGTVTGAYWSGEGVGRRIAEKYGLAQPDDAESVTGEEEAGGSTKPVNVRGFADNVLEKQKYV